MRGLGSRNFASNTFFAVARSAAWLSARRVSALVRAGLGAMSSLTISSGCEAISGSSSRVVMRAGCGSSTLAAAGAAGSALARRWASSLAFSAFLRASSSRLMSAAQRRRRALRRLLARIGFEEEVFPGEQAAEAAVISFDARVADHRGAQKDHQLGLLVQILALLEDLADAGDFSNARDHVLGLRQ